MLSHTGILWSSRSWSNFCLITCRFLIIIQGVWALFPVSFSWRDLGLLRSSFNLGSTQILDTCIQTGNLVHAATDKEVRDSIAPNSKKEWSPAEICSYIVILVNRGLKQSRRWYPYCVFLFVCVFLHFVDACTVITLQIALQYSQMYPMRKVR